VVDFGFEFGGGPDCAGACGLDGVGVGFRGCISSCWIVYQRNTADAENVCRWLTLL
jgi:hypothetical protein